MPKPASPTTNTIRHQPALDGLRGAALVGMLCYHASVPGAHGAFLSIDTFFCLSGYLITALLLAEWTARGTIRLRVFWGRRARRLLPALLTLIAAIGLFARYWAAADQLDTLRHEAWATLLYVANWKSILSGTEYMDQFKAPSPLMHAWSLAIEEQWYFVWPIVLVLLLRQRVISRRGVLVVVLGLSVASATWMAVLHASTANAGRAYFGTDTRAQSLLIGAALALALDLYGEFRADWARTAIQWAGLLALVVTGWLWTATSRDDVWVWRGGFFLAAACTATIIAAAIQPGGGPVTWFLSLWPLRMVGLISYGMYLWHWPVYVVLNGPRTGLQGMTLLAVRLAVATLFAVVSYYVVEMPIRRGALPRWRGWIAVPTAAVAAMTIVTLATTSRSSSALAPATAVVHATPVPPDVVTTPEEQAAQKTLPPTKLLLAGDSQAVTLGLGLERIYDQYGLVVWSVGTLGCGVMRGTVWVEGRVLPVADVCADWPTRWRAQVEAFHPDVVLVVIGPWETWDTLKDGKWITFGTPESDAYVLSEFGAAIDVLSSTGASVALLRVPHYFPRATVTDNGKYRSSYDPSGWII